MTIPLMQDAPANSTAVQSTVPYRSVVLTLEKPFPDTGTTLTPRQAHYAKTILIATAAIGRLTDKVKRSIFYGQNIDLTSGEIKMAVEVLEKVLRSLTGEMAESERYDVRVTRQQVRLLHAAFGLNTESAEITETALDHIFNMEPLDSLNMREELGDVRWYYELACDVIGTTDWEVCSYNAKKLFKRYPGKFDQNAAVERNLAAERKVLQ